ncbi:UNVERIFIED_CONTAM: hypothetical protein Sradi_2340500 [Sesamum radiatum]|uniref:Uncharacterized protein n=1 Tax=Sesamum radiatum TaxID=300843 RepID=A0AAW2T605_SESRA
MLADVGYTSLSLSSVRDVVGGWQAVCADMHAHRQADAPCAEIYGRQGARVRIEADALGKQSEQVRTTSAAWAIGCARVQTGSAGWRQNTHRCGTASACWQMVGMKYSRWTVILGRLARLCAWVAQRCRWPRRRAHMVDRQTAVGSGQGLVVG